MRDIYDRVVDSLTTGTYTVNSTKCFDDLKTWAVDLATFKPYAASMLDAWGKVPSGLLYGDILWMGNYDECRDNTNTTIANKTMDFEYSLVTLSNLIPPKPGVPSSFDLQVGICLPKTCTTDDVNALFNATINDPVDPFNVTAYAHQNEEFSLDAADYSFIAFAALLFLLISIVTTIDIYKSDWVNKEFGYLSFKRNLRFITNRPKSNKQLKTFDGVRALSMTWVVIGHGLYEPIASQVTSNGLDIFNKWPKPIMALTVLNATLLLTVDSFFLISAALFSYLFTARKVNWRQSLLAILFRFLRLTPYYAFIIFFYATVYENLLDGPVSQLITQDEIQACKNSWYYNILYVNNIPNLYDSMAKTCVVQSWYLAVDFQCFLLGLFALLLLNWRYWVGIGFCSFCIMSSIIIKAVQSDYFGFYPISFLWDGYPQHGKSESRYTNHLYYAASYFNIFMRMDTYFLGVLYGLLFRQLKDGKLNKLRRLPLWSQIIGWLVASLCLLGALYGTHGYYLHDVSQTVSNFYNATFRVAWALGLAWFLFAAEFGYAEPVRYTLSLDIWYVIGRLSYGIYLIHLFVYKYYYAQLRQALYFTHLSLFFTHLAVFTISTCAAFVLHFAIEIPLKLYLDRFARMLTKSEVKQEANVEKAKNEKC